MRAIQEAKKYGRRGEDEEQVGQNAKPAGPEASRALAPTPAAPAHPPSEVVTSQEPPSNDEIDNGLDEPTTAGFDYSQNLATSRYNVQVRIGPNGETIVDEESLFVDRNEDDDTANYTHVEESDATKFVNSASYSKKVKGSRWSAEETELFYDALSQFGENYEMISMLLPGRDRKACKNKFKAEDKKNPARINYCLTHRVPYDMQTLSRLTGKDFSGPTPEIRAPTPLTLAETETNNQSETGTNNTVKRKRKSSTTPGIPSDGEEVMGTVEDYELEEQTLFGSPTAELAGTVETH
ncbi:hypothetical protein GLOTRDRAFT_67965 [Gloeophyllum trabeum ATCC 11539]|uniref:Uncharacterized protein n=1 Tax=Gloeophyllum trabeum (strain ATCC 11539 / FP-39264 / Madison 617) TaxID=670483 RepID=S7QLR2_GLOTA|nr:uncharacterized protein GLOTRDRAFT_67965 [Gloeophyllum trabeum ATCC 11539]EPQ60383.1 hypothetical protein GLOTRDRAFT_67965 [Gloeophyllum trabeum ATCC 11539]